jgi:hypothetical protein
MKYLLLVLLICLGSPLLANAAAGDDCRSTINTKGNNKQGVHCTILYDWASDADGTLVAAPLGSSACTTMVYVHSLTGTSPQMDDWRLMGYDVSAIATGTIGHTLAAFDNDGTVTAGLCPDSPSATTCGTTLWHIVGPSLPYLQFDAGTTGGPVTDFLIYILQFECPGI